MDYLVGFRIRCYPFIHGLFCEGDLEVFIPTEDHMKETGDTEAYMLCSLCGKRYHLVNLTPEDA